MAAKVVQAGRLTAVAQVATTAGDGATTKVEVQLSLAPQISVTV